MSATARGAERVQHDAYHTPAWAVHRLLEACPLPGGVWLEPCAGEGAIIRAVDSIRTGDDYAWAACEVREECRGVLQELLGREPVIGSYLDVELAGADVIITNPPYGIAFEIAQKALREAPTVALLLRLNWLASADRAEWLRANTPSVYVLPDRPAFIASIACANRKLCGWRVSLPLDAPWSRKCPACSAPATRTTTDATDYAWLVWRQGVTPTVTVLAPTPLAERQACSARRAA